MIKLAEDASQMNGNIIIPQTFSKEKKTSDFPLTFPHKAEQSCTFFCIHLPKHSEALARLQISLEIKDASEWLPLQAAYSVIKSGLGSVRFERQRTQGDPRAQRSEAEQGCSALSSTSCCTFTLQTPKVSERLQQRYCST